MEVYLDNAATTRVFDEVREKINTVMDIDYGNPSSLHQKGVDAERYIKEAKDIFSNILKVENKTIYFTSGGTESNNTALIGGALARQRSGKRIISTRIEHPSVYNPLLFLEEQGFEVIFLNVDRHGIIDMEELKEAMTPDTILVSTMIVNNEMGAIEPVEEISKYIKSINPNVLYHVDAIQGFGKLNIYPRRMGIDMLSVSGHKIHGPKGVGILYVADKVNIKPIIYGGGQQKGMRSGTENVPGVAGMALAAKLIYEDFDNGIKHLSKLKNTFIEKVTKLENVYSNSGEAPHIASISFRGVRSEVLLHALEDKGIYVSSGSACSSNHPSISGTLQAIEVEEDLLESTLRFSFSCFNSEEDIEYTVAAIEELLPVLRKYTRKK